MRLPTVEDVERLLPRPQDFTSKARGTQLTARVGSALGIAFTICFLTGVWSHFQYDTPSWVPLGPDPTHLYRVTQGLHVISGTAAVPLLLVKLWSVFPRLFRRPRVSSWRDLPVVLVERASIGVLVAASIFMLASGLLNIAQWYPWEFSFRRTHEAVAWVAIGSLIIHIGVKLPVIRRGLRSPLQRPRQHLDPDAIDRRTVMRATFGAAGLAALLTAGQTVPFLRRVSVFGVRDGDGPQGLPINRTAKAAGAEDSARDPSFVLEIVAAGRTLSLSREDLTKLPQRTHRLPIACVEGWSRDALWTGVAVRDLLGLVDADPHSEVTVRSLQTRGAFGVSVLPADFVEDHRTLLALELNGETLSVDHGFPCRIIAPNRPGVLQTKWVQRLEVRT